MRLLIAGILLGLASLATAQQGAAEPKPQADPPARVREAIEGWVAGDQVDEAHLRRTVDAVLADPAVGLPILGSELSAAKPADSPRAKGLSQLATKASIAFVEREERSEMSFAGQYLPLQPLQPFVGELFLRLLLETPDWFADNHRVRLVMPLRDLLPLPPRADAMEGIIALVEDTEIEPQDLRLALACALHQWGHPRYVQPFLEERRLASTEGDAEDRIDALRDLSTILVRLRDPAAALREHLAMQAMADSGGHRLWPADWYQAACLHALTGDVEKGFGALDRLAALQLDRSTDPSLRIARRVLEKDPELELLRRDARYAAFLSRLFPEPAEQPVKPSGSAKG